MRTVRHPMDPFNSFAMVCAGLVGFMCVALGMIGGSLFFMLLAQHWVVTCIGLVAIPLMYAIILEGDRLGVERFGDAYRQYMKRVPRINVFLGALRALRERRLG